MGRGKKKQQKENEKIAASNGVTMTPATFSSAGEPIPQPEPGMIIGGKRTGAMVLVSDADDRVLLVQDKLFSCTEFFSREVEHLWTLPGGGKEGASESLAMCASRELFEETRGLLLVSPSYFEQCELVGACQDVETHDGLRRVYGIKIVGETFDVSLFDRGRKRNASFNETGDCCLIKRVDFHAALFSLMADFPLQRVTKTGEVLPVAPLMQENITNRAISAVGCFARGEPVLSIAISPTSKQSCLPLLGTMGYTKYDLCEVEVRYVSTGYVEVRPLRRIHTGLYNADGRPADEAFGADPNCWSCCGGRGFDAAPCELV